MNLEPFFKAKRIAVVGASREPGKVGHVILKNLLGKGFQLYPINPLADEILGLTCFKSITHVLQPVDLAIIATPSQTVPGIIDECGKKGIKHVIIISAGFKEVGNVKLEKELEAALTRSKITAIGPNCLGVFDAHTKLDTLFLPPERLKRPRPGKLSFISQSGALGSAVLDLAAAEGYGFAKFVSYGNAVNVDESDLLAYLENDPMTDVICLYVEAIKSGRKFLDVAGKKPVIVIKGGVTEAGAHAALSHTGSLAGSAEMYEGAFRQAGCVIAYSLEELFEYAKVFEKTHVRAKGKRVQIITNGGGYGILATDAMVKQGLEGAQPSKETVKALKKQLPPEVVVGNPIDLLGDATTERYKLALDLTLTDTQNDALVVIVLPQVPRVDERIIDVVIEAHAKAKKPLVAVTTGSEYAQRMKQRLEAGGVPTFMFPENGVRALASYLKRT